MSTAYTVLKYSIEKLIHTLAEKSRAPEHAIKDKRHLDYFKEYFDAVGAKTIIVENEYVDKDYLEDFASYYVSCFQRYERNCARLHFFDIEFDESAFEGIMCGSQSGLQQQNLQNAYLGFIVIKPLPLTIIGRTCLKPYAEEGRRHFPITRLYRSHLFGISLTVTSLAFQEQDTVAAACATSALWSAFQGTGLQFQHHIPSPVSITRAATVHVPHQNRTFPESNGLSISQMSDAIRSVGLEPFLVSAANQNVMKSSIYAYLRGRIPVILIMELIDPKNPKDPVGCHAVTVSGYDLGISGVAPFQTEGTRLRALRMDKIYAHDDQIGPFARMKFLKDAFLSTSWLTDKGDSLDARASLMLVPLYHKIRIPLQTILESVFPFDNVLELCRSNGWDGLSERLEWDIYLTDNSTLKKELRDSGVLPQQYKARLLTCPMPRFLWRATAMANDTLILDLIFDATDIEQGCFLVCAIDYDRKFASSLRDLSKTLLDSKQLPKVTSRLFEWYVKSEHFED